MNKLPTVVAWYSITTRLYRESDAVTIASLTALLTHVLRNAVVAVLLILLLIYALKMLLNIYLLTTTNGFYRVTPMQRMCTARYVL